MSVFDRAVANPGKKARQKAGQFVAEHKGNDAFRRPHPARRPVRSARRASPDKSTESPQFIDDKSSKKRFFDKKIQNERFLSTALTDAAATPYLTHCFNSIFSRNKVPIETRNYKNLMKIAWQRQSHDLNRKRSGWFPNRKASA